MVEEENGRKTSIRLLGFAFNKRNWGVEVFRKSRGQKLDC